MKDFWSKNEQKIVLFFILIMIAVISFEFGLIQGKKSQNSPMIIEKVAQAQKEDPGMPLEAIAKAQNLTQEAKIAQNDISTQSENLAVKNTANCAYVGSKNSDKFYPPTCSYAKRVKPENLVCFQSAEEAVAQGRTASAGCK